VFNLGFSELALVLVVALIFLGPKMLPEIASGLGKVIREIRKATADIRQDIELDELIHKPLQELREAATLPPEELKRRDEARALRRKAEQEETRRKQEEAKAAAQKQRETEEMTKKAAEKSEPKKPEGPATAVPFVLPTDAISRGGTMIASPPPANDMQTLTPMPEILTPAPVVTAPPPPRPALPPPLPRSTSAKPATTLASTIVERPPLPKTAAKTQAPPIPPGAAPASSGLPGKPGKPEKPEKKEG